jgi:hypothetical protein
MGNALAGFAGQFAQDVVVACERLPAVIRFVLLNQVDISATTSLPEFINALAVLRLVR